jgi:poly-gamma-glutamate capsule biosynthesis protein CapA/YwtB (metallophosphatase superfamily)
MSESSAERRNLVGSPAAAERDARKSVKVVVGGDVCPIGGNTPYFAAGDAEALFHDLLDDFDDADLVIANLECPLITEPSPIQKMGPVFGANARCINGMRAAGLDVLCLANNHVLDHGPAGLASTLAVCAGAGIETVGAGANLRAAQKVLLRDIAGTVVGIVAMAEHEFSIATNSGPGANPLDLIDYVRTIATVHQSVDYLIVLLHGGAEFLTVPSPRLKKTCHFLIDMGADAVVVQHPHALGGYERYQGGFIVYGQGALVMDEAIYRDKKSFHEGVLVRFTVQDSGGSMELIPLVQSDPVPGARRLKARDAETLLRELEAKSQALLDDDYVNAEWKRFCEEQKHAYISVLAGHSRAVRVANRSGRLAGLLYNRRRLLGTRNVVCCETHREALETIFNEELI